MTAIHLPTLNAALNFLSAVFLLAGYVAIKRDNVAVHRAFMGSALITSTVFLTSYLYYHYHAGSKHFEGLGWIRPVYFSILISHTILAAAIVPLILTAVWKALRGNFVGHARVARITWPLWMYVSVTGVVIYWMLYR